VAEFLIILVILTNLRMLTSGRLVTLIHWVALQGVALGLFALVSRLGHLQLDVFVIGLVAMFLKGVVFPRMLLHAVMTVDVHQERDPFIGYIASILLGLVALAASLWLGTRIHIPGLDHSRLLVPATLFSVFSGQLLIIGRKNAITQVIGFLVMENGAFMMGVGSLYYAPFLVEIGVLLDMSWRSS
jgi:hydrogenase-4 component E